MKKRRKASAAQLRALARGRAKRRRLHRNAPSRPRRPSRRRRLLAGRRRRAVIRKRTRRAARHAIKNPFLGGLAVMGNPHRRRRRSHRRSRRSRRSSRSLIFRNPIGGSVAAVAAPVREMVSKDFLLQSASIAAGFVLPGIVTSRFVPVNWRDTPLKGYLVKVGVIAGLAAGTSMLSKRASKAILLGGGVSLALDLYTDFGQPLLGRVLGGGAPAALPAPAGGTATYYGDRGMGAYYGGHDGLSGAEGASIGAAFGGGGEPVYA